jgi:PAS domain S-box-containing protein
MRTPWRSTLVDCGIALGGVALATLVRHWLKPLLHDSHAFVTYYIAIMFAAWLGGLVPALLTLGMGALAGAFFFIHPPHTMFVHTADQIVGLVLYISVGLTAIMFFAAIRATRARAEATSERLQLHQAELEREVRERRAAEESLRQSEERFRTLVDSNIIGLMVTDDEGRIVHANDELLRMLGYRREEFAGMTPRPTWRDLTPPEHAADDDRAMQQIDRDGSCAAYEKTFWRKGGSSRVPVLIGGARFRRNEPGGIAFVLDMTDAHRARQTLQLQSRVLESVAEGVVVVVADEGRRIVFTNPSHDAMFGYGRGELVGQSLQRLGDLSPEELRDLDEEIDLALRIRGSWTGEMRNRRKDGSTFVSEATVARLRAGRAGAAAAASADGGVDDAGYLIFVQQDVTARRAVEDAARAAEQRLALAMAAVEMGTWELDIATDQLTASMQVRGLLRDGTGDGGTGDGGTGDGQTVSMESFFQTLHEDDRDPVRQAVRDAIAGLREYDVEFRGIRPDGSVRWLHARAALFSDEHTQQPRRLTGVTIDVTDAKAAAGSLRLSEERFRLASEAAQSIIYDWDVTNDRVYRSPGLSRVLGVAPEDADAGHGWWLSRIHPDDLDPVRAQENEALTASGHFSIEYRMRHEEGHWVHVWDRGFVVRDASDPHGSVRVVGSTIDISDRKRAELELRNSEHRYRTFITQSSEGVYRIEADEPIPVALPVEEQIERMLATTFVAECNDAMARMYGFEFAEQMMGSRTEARLERSDPRNVAYLRAFIEGGYRLTDGESIEQDVYGKRRHFLKNLVGTVEDGRLVHAWGTQRDVTDRVLAEQALRDSEERFRQFAQASRDVLWIRKLDRPGIEYLSPAFERVWGRERDELFVSTAVWLSWLHPDDRERMRDRTQELLNAGTMTLEYRIVRRDGEVRWISDSSFVIRDDAGEVIRVGGIAQDVTERVEAQEELRQAKDVAESADRAKDQFLAVLSHELRTPLTPVLGSVQMMSSDESVPGEMRRELEMIRRNIELEARLIDDLLDLTRVAKGKVELVHQPCDVHLAVRRAVEICRPELEAKHLSVRLDLLSQRSMVIADPARLQQVVWNLVKNAIKFTPPEGGEIVVESADQPQEGGGNQLVIRVIDRGIGIEPEALTRIFDAFEQGSRAVAGRYGGLGLGLAISKTLVEMHGGRLAAESEGPGRGATFTLRLPVADIINVPPLPTPESPTDREAAQPSDESAPLRILLVEDHEDTARVMTRLLRTYHYDVTTANDVSSALRIAASAPFDLVISDLGLPDGSGLDLMRHLLEQHGREPSGSSTDSAIKGIALSGYGMEADRQRSRDAGFAEHLTKPVDLQRLKDVIRDVVERGKEQHA